MAFYAACAVACAVALLLPAGIDSRAVRVTGRRSRSVSLLIAPLAVQLHARSPRAARHRRAEALDALGALEAELHAGLPSRTALARALSDFPELLPRTLAAARFGGDVVEGMRSDASSVPLLRALAAAWHVGEDAGAGLAASVSTLLRSARESEEVRRQLEAQLAAPRATARMLCALPLIGILMGLLLGGNPLQWLMSTTIGRICLVAGMALTALGVWWTHRIAAGAQARA